MVDVGGARIAVPAVLEEAGPQILSIGQQIDQELNQLRALLAPLASEWTGAAAGGHSVTQAAWNSAAQNLMTDVGTLGALGHTVNTNWGNYVATEGANATSWAT